MTVDMSSSTSNIELIKQQFEEVIGYSQGFKANVDNLFTEWFEAKRDYIEAWGGQLAIEIPEKVVFELSQKDKDARLDEFINIVSVTFDNEPLAQFIEDNRKGFFQNKVILPWYNRDTGVDIPEGMKLLKAFKYFESDEIILKDLQTQASMIIQEDKVEGYLCFSVHPLDFLSSSENTYNWRSCHALDGEYRAGNLSYMVDKSTVMCYLRGAENVILPDFPPTVRWNSKKWRMLLFFSEYWDVLFAGRQYPFFSRAALDVVMKHLTTTILHGKWSEWHDDHISSYEYKEKNGYDGGTLMWPYICISNELVRLKDVVQDGPYSLQFNDLLRSSCYKPYYCFRYYRPIEATPRLIVGGAAPCCHCGNDHIVAPDTMLCEECELDFGSSDDERFGYCDCCDRRMVIEDGHFIASRGQLVCEWCYDTMVKQCECCGNDFFNDEIMYDKPTHSYRCSSCCSNRGRVYSGCTSSVNDGGIYSYMQHYSEPTISEYSPTIKINLNNYSREQLADLVEKICHSEDY